MKQGIVKFSKEFKTITGNVWLGVENEYDMGTEDPIDVFKRAEETVNKYASMSGLLIHFNYDGSFVSPSPYPADYTTSNAGPRVIEKNPEDREVGLNPELLMSCQDLVTLQTFYPLVFKLTKGDDALKDAYNKRKSELVAKESKELLEVSKK